LNLADLALVSQWNDLIIGDLCPTGYSFLHTPRHGSIGGGVGLLFKESLNIKRNAQEVFRLIFINSKRMY
jgi:hypothetical protein